MCIGFSCVVTRAGQVLWDKMSNSHEEIKKKNKLADDKLDDRDIVNCEVLPLNNLTSGKEKDYKIRVDEEGTLPTWWTDNSKELMGKVMKLWLEIVLPDWIKNGVGGWLNLQGTGITSLGNLTSVGGYLYLQGTGITSLGNVKVAGTVYGLKEVK